MKRHLNSLLQRRHADLSEIRSSAGLRRSAPVNKSPGSTAVEVRDGYDWLAVIKREPGQRMR